MPSDTSRRTHWLLRVLLVLATLAVLLAIPVVVFLINNRPPNIFVPTPKVPKNNGWDDFVKAGDMIEKTPLPHGPDSDASRRPEQWRLADYRPFIRASDPALAVLRRGLRKPYLCPTIRAAKDYSGSIRPFARFRETARVLRGEARYYELNGKYNVASDFLLDGIELGVVLPRGGDLITALMGVAVESIAIRPFPLLLPKLSSRDLAEVAKRVDRIQRGRTRYSEIVMEEGRARTAEEATTFRDPATIKSLADPRNWVEGDMLTLGKAKSSEDTWRNTRLAFVNKSRMLRENEAYYKAVAAEQLGFYRGKSAVPVPNNPMARFGGGMDIGVVVRARASICIDEARLALLQTEVALRRYRFDHGKYPDRLAQLVPAYLKSIPVDPFGLGKPLRYKPLNNGRSFLLYSLGPDLKDDGGRTEKWHGADTKGDMVLGKW